MKHKFSIRFLSVAAFAVFFARSTFAQGCALCYTQAASAPSRFVHALRGGILVLIFPPLFISASFAVTAYRKRNHFHSSSAPDSPSSKTSDNKTSVP